MRSMTQLDDDFPRGRDSRLVQTLQCLWDSGIHDRKDLSDAAYKELGKKDLRLALDHYVRSFISSRRQTVDRRMRRAVTERQYALEHGMDHELFDRRITSMIDDWRSQQFRVNGGIVTFGESTVNDHREYIAWATKTIGGHEQTVMLHTKLIAQMRKHDIVTLGEIQDDAEVVDLMSQVYKITPKPKKK